MRVLVTFGSKRGGTRGLANMLGSALEDQGLEVTLMPAAGVMDARPFDAVIVGGALYNNRWHKDARRFVDRHAKTLQDRPVWLFSSGPLDDSAVTGDIGPVKHVAKAMEGIGANGHMTFGGRLQTDADSFPASSMAKTMSGDWRDEAHVRDWAKRISEELR